MVIGLREAIGRDRHEARDVALSVHVRRVDSPPSRVVRKSGRAIESATRIALEETLAARLTFCTKSFGRPVEVGSIGFSCAAVSADARTSIARQRRGACRPCRCGCLEESIQFCTSRIAGASRRRSAGRGRRAPRPSPCRLTRSARGEDRIARLAESFHCSRNAWSHTHRTRAPSRWATPGTSSRARDTSTGRALAIHRCASYVVPRSKRTSEGSYPRID